MDREVNKRIPSPSSPPSPSLPSSSFHLRSSGSGAMVRSSSSSIIPPLIYTWLDMVILTCRYRWYSWIVEELTMVTWWVSLGFVVVAVSNTFDVPITGQAGDAADRETSRLSGDHTLFQRPPASERLPGEAGGPWDARPPELLLPFHHRILAVFLVIGRLTHSLLDPTSINYSTAREMGHIHIYMQPIIEFRKYQ